MLRLVLRNFNEGGSLTKLFAIIMLLFRYNKNVESELIKRRSINVSITKKHTD